MDDVVWIEGRDDRCDETRTLGEELLADKVCARHRNRPEERLWNDHEQIGTAEKLTEREKIRVNRRSHGVSSACNPQAFSGDDVLRVFGEEGVAILEEIGLAQSHPIDETDQKRGRQDRCDSNSRPLVRSKPVPIPDQVAARLPSFIDSQGYLIYPRRATSAIESLFARWWPSLLRGSGC